MIGLLDVSFLIALFDQAHLDHGVANEWFARHRHLGWSTCPIVQNGCVRIMTQRAYLNPFSLSEICRRVRNATMASDHYFWPDDISILDDSAIDLATTSSRHLTDVYLLALATHHGGRLVTFDQNIALEAVKAATLANLLVL